ncbi:kinase-like domain-containing protein [Rhizophagus clarus]|uniref:Kinase-like domain-containing protein n=1 Tax=Rhizophagus clarus TaxID=94130 RepID=A0A8H3L1X1_9GLOM|nr:kinase-like domain-containing protein [Rhizophagus clarus]
MESSKEIFASSPDQTSSNNSNHSPNFNDNLKFIDFSRFEKISGLNNNLNDLGIELFKAYWKDTNSLVILKKFHSQYLENIKSFYKVCYHQNILPIYGFSKKPDSEDYFLITEYANGGNLRNYLKEHFYRLSWNDKMRFATDLTSGLQYIHNYGIVHLTLHPYNIFVHNNRLLIGDIGLSKPMTDVSIPENFKILPYIEPDLTFPCDKKSNIYSLGFILYELSSGKPSFISVRHDLKLRKKLLSGEREKPVAGTPIEYIDLYEQCWDDDPLTRPSTEDILSRLGRMNLSSIYEDIEIKTLKTNNEKKNVNNNINNINNKKNEFDVVSEASTQNRLDSVVLDFGGGVDSGFGSVTRKTIKAKGREREKMSTFTMLTKMQDHFWSFPMLDVCNSFNSLCIFRRLSNKTY